ncbi:MAG TPA: HAD family hydrolase [Kofleriaceae bacterium]|nr:HAD family hydrolase [Kofleriaceae bacterium]
MADPRSRPALFLDRDGVVNEEIAYLHRPEDVRLVAGVAGAIAQANAAGIPVVVVTNQAGIARGLYGEADLAAVGARIAALLAPAVLAATYHCPHHPEARVTALRVVCDCRKPAPGLLLRAARDHGLDLGRSFLVGDKASDLGAARAAGCGSVLVRTGYGAATEREVEGAGLHDAVFDTLAAAMPYLLARLTA